MFSVLFPGQGSQYVGMGKKLPREQVGTRVRDGMADGGGGRVGLALAATSGGFRQLGSRERASRIRRG